MRKFLASLAILLGLSAPALAALAIDGTPDQCINPSGTTCAMSLVTTVGNDILIVQVTVTSSRTVSTITDTNSLTWIKRASIVNGVTNNEEWYAIAALSARTYSITVTMSGITASPALIMGAAISGANTTTPFDGSAVTSATASASITTTHANTMIIGSQRLSVATTTAAAGFTLSQASLSNGLSEYKIVSTTQSGLTVNSGDASALSTIADALVQAGGVTATHTLMTTGAGQ